ncbi:MAG: tetratricopeptide repeat protein [Bacteroidia bacterium]|jgi:tetratricopeptide (TPR) repeat protein
MKRETNPLHFSFLLRLGILSGIFLVLTLSWFCQPGENATTESSPFLNHHDSVNYVGKQTCRSCHSDIYSSFIRTGMGSSFERATRTKSAAEFKRHSVVYDKFNNLSYFPFWKNDTMYIMEFRLAGKDTIHKRVERVDYIIGSGQHTNSHLMEVNGYVYQLPLTWYAQKKQWDLPPGFEEGRNVRFNRSIGFECMSCHNAMPVMDEHSGNKFSSIGDGIDCERCHGPGEVHVQRKLAGIRVDIAKEADYTIVNPRRLSWELQIDICQRCHLQGNAVLKEGKKFNDFRPGQKLSDYMDIYMPRYSGRDDEMIMASHAQRLQMSKCFLQSASSDKKLSCITCHNPHVSVQVTGKEVFNQSCKSCHNNGDNCKEKMSVRLQAKDNCVQCHMPRSGTIDIPHVTVTDHRISKPVKAHVVSDIKTFAGIYCINNPRSNMEMRMQALLAYREKFEGEISVLDSVAGYLNAIQDHSTLHNAMSIHLNYLKKEYSKVIVESKRSQPDQWSDPWVCYRIGQSYQNTNEPVQALSWYKRACSLAPSNLEFGNKYAAILIETGALDEGIKLLQDLLKRNNRQTEVYTNLGFAYVKQYKYTEALEAYHAALQLDPDHIQTLFNKAALVNIQGDQKLARKLLQRILEKDPGNEYVRQIMQSIPTR